MSICKCACTHVCIGVNARNANLGNCSYTAERHLTLHLMPYRMNTYKVLLNDDVCGEGLFIRVWSKMRQTSLKPLILQAKLQPMVKCATNMHV